MQSFVIIVKHIEANCTAKTKEAPKCFQCAGDHKSKKRAMAEKKCITCLSYKKKPEMHILS